MAENRGSVPDADRKDQTAVPARSDGGPRTGREENRDGSRERTCGWQTDDEGVK